MTSTGEVQKYILRKRAGPDTTSASTDPLVVLGPGRSAVTATAYGHDSVSVRSAAAPSLVPQWSANLRGRDDVRVLARLPCVSVARRRRSVADGSPSRVCCRLFVHKTVEDLCKTAPTLCERGEMLWIPALDRVHDRDC
jgi:hypothetical protein